MGAKTPSADTAKNPIQSRGIYVARTSANMKRARLFRAVRTRRTRANKKCPCDRETVIYERFSRIYETRRGCTNKAEQERTKQPFLCAEQGNRPPLGDGPVRETCSVCEDLKDRARACPRSGSSPLRPGGHVMGGWRCGGSRRLMSVLALSRPRSDRGKREG